MGGCCLFKYNGGDSGIKISVLYWRCSLITLSVIRGSTVLSRVASPALSCFSTLRQNQRDFRGGGGILLSIKCTF
jgi:hypothetical protein